MTPPLIKPLVLDQSLLLNSQDIFFFSDHLLETSPSLETRAVSHPREYRLLDSALHWNPSKLWLHSAQVKVGIPPSAPVESKSWTGAETFQFISNILLLTESLDLEAKGMISNGGEGGCRFEEMAARKDVISLYEVCLVKFEENTRADLSLQLRKMENSNESLINLFRVRYDKNIYKDVFPDNQVQVQGFQFMPLPEEPISFDQAGFSLGKQGYSMRYMVEPSGLLSIPILGYPIFKLEAEPNEKLDLTRDFLLSLGITQEVAYAQAHTDHFRLPQKVADFLTLIKHIESDDEKISVVNINRLRGRPPLFDWLSFQSIDWTSRWREGKLKIPHFGYFIIGRTKSMNPGGLLEIRSQNGEMKVNLFQLEISEAVFRIDSQEIRIKGMRIGNLSSRLPAFIDLIQQIKAGKFNLNDLEIVAKNITAEEIVIHDSKNRITTQLNNVHLGNLHFEGKDQIHTTDIRAGKLEINASQFNAALKIQNSLIPSIEFKRRETLETLYIPRIEGGQTSIEQASTTVIAKQSSFKNLRWNENQSKSDLFIESFRSRGSIDYFTPSGFSFDTSGASQIDKIHLEHFKSGIFKASLVLSGKVNRLQLQQGPFIQLNLKHAEFNASPLMIQFQSTHTTQELENIQYDFDFNIQNTAIDRSQFGNITLAPSSLLNSRLRLIQTEKDSFQIPQIYFQGELDIQIESILGSNESFNLPGLSITGGIYDIALRGPVHFNMDTNGWTLERLQIASNENITAHANIRNIELVHNPQLIAGNRLNEWPFHQVVKTEMRIDSADFFVGNLERIGFSNRLSSVEIQDIRFENIQAQGVIWAKFPLFYYMRGVFPEIGSRHTESESSPSFVSLKRFSIHSPEQGPPLTTLEEFKTEIHEVDGNETFAKVHIPLLTVGLQGNNWVETGNQINRTNLYLIDKARGGWIKLKSVPRPLEQRRSRVLD